jgi:hypothetical protein
VKYLILILNISYRRQTKLLRDVGVLDCLGDANISADDHLRRERTWGLDGGLSLRDTGVEVLVLVES